MSLAGCAPSYSPDTYASSAVQQASKVERGVIVGARAVAVQASGATGGVAGAAAGGLVASQAPGTGVGNALTTLGGTLVGGLVGTGIERATGDTVATEYIVRTAKDELVGVTQKDAVVLAVGTKVLVIAGSQARVVVDYTVPETPKPTSTPKPTLTPGPQSTPGPTTAPAEPPSAAPATSVPTVPDPPKPPSES